ncbi:MAG: universal stress protein [Thermodesulfobacteriota bacterium]
MMKILVGVNKSEESLLALRYACHLKEHFPAEVDALYVKPDVVEIAGDGAYAPFTTRGDIEKEVEREAAKVVEEIFETCQICLGVQVPCNPMVAVGDPAEEILRVAHEDRYDLILLGGPSRSTFQGLLLGAVHNKVLLHAKPPILIVRNYREIKRVLAAYRGSSCDQGALEFIAPLLARKKPEITVLHVQEMEKGESREFAEACVLTGRDTLQSHGFSPVTKLAQGGFEEEVLKEVALGRYDLVILGAYGHKRPKYLPVISDEALNLARLTTRPVLVYREVRPD